MQRRKYIQILLIVLIFTSVNIFPLAWGSRDNSTGDNVSLSLELYPEPPYNNTFFNSEMTVTLLLQNDGSGSKEFRYWISKSSENLFVNGRDGVKLPAQDTIGGKENYYQSFALVPLATEENSLNFEITIADKDNNPIKSEEFKLKISQLHLGPDEVKAIGENFGLSSDMKTFLIPRYKRYWHPERNESGKSVLNYVWLVIGESQNVLVNDNTGKIMRENLVLPWEVSSFNYENVKLWNGSRFENKQIPITKIKGDLSFNHERLELYFAPRDNEPAWISRRIFYWNPKDLVLRSLDEVPDTERVEFWISADTGEALSTISDYHHYTFRYDPIESYTIQTYYHSPLPSDAPLLWSDFTLVNYSEVYSSGSHSNLGHNHLGFCKEVHPIDEALAEKLPLIMRNLVGVGLALLVLIFFRKWGNKVSFARGDSLP